MGKRGNREGSIYKRADGRWVASVTIGGGQPRKYLYGRTRQEVARKLTQALKATQDNLPIPSSRLTLAVFADKWLASVRSSLRPRTYQSYESALRVHILPSLGRIQLDALQPSDLELLYARLTQDGLSAQSIRTYHVRVHTMLNRAVKWGVLTRNVASLVALPRIVPRELAVFSHQEAKAFLQAAIGHRLEALFVLALTTGARQGELLGLRWDRVDLDNGHIDIRQALQRIDGRFQLVEPKTSSSARRVALTDIAVEALRHHHTRQLKEALRLGQAWDNDMDLVFCTTIGSPLDKANVTRREFRSVLRHAGLTPQLRFHDLRHISASLALGEGMSVTSVSEMLGHSSPATTLRVYAHAIPGADRLVADALQNLLAS